MPRRCTGHRALVFDFRGTWVLVSSPPSGRLRVMNPCFARAVTAALLCVPFACTTSTLRPTPGALGFDEPLAGWNAASTGGRGPDSTWLVHADPAAISPPNVLSLSAQNHASEDRFNLYWTAGTRFRDGMLSVAVRANGGDLDQGGGPVWRVQDANNYYVCRFNPLESNYRVYVVKDGVRRQLGNAPIETRVGEWVRLDVEHRGDRIVCSLDGRKLLDVTDASIEAEGGVGVWTKADARTSFDDFSIAP